MLSLSIRLKAIEEKASRREGRQHKSPNRKNRERDGPWDNIKINMHIIGILEREEISDRKGERLIN